MILQALARYYEILAQAPDAVPPFGYSIEYIQYVLYLSRHGELLGFVPLEDASTMFMPENVDRASDVNPNFLYDNSGYVFGFSMKDKKKDGEPTHYSEKRFPAFREHNLALLRMANCETAQAVINFLERYSAAELQTHERVKPHIESILKQDGNFVFQVEGQDRFAHQDPKIREIWDTWILRNASKYTAQCLILGEIAPIARLHKKIKGLGDTPIPLVSFDKDSTAYTSFNWIEGYNAPVSEMAAFRYKTALNYLLSIKNPSPRVNIGNTRVIYWAESENRAYADRFAELWGATNTEESEEIGKPTSQRDTEGQLLLDSIAGKIRQVKNIDLDAVVDGLDKDTRFYVLGLEANKGRITIRFFHTEPFIKIAQRLVNHYKAMEIANERGYPAKPIQIWRILDETVPHSIKENRKARISPFLPGAVLASIFREAPYPAPLYQAIINRVRSEIDKPTTDKEPEFDRINHTRAAILKACLIRKKLKPDQFMKQEDFLMALNEQCTNQAYLLGRLFAVLERIQTKALPELNVTIKDRYFTSACTSPVLVFSRLVKLSRHHLAKLSKGSEIWYEKLIQGIYGLMECENNPYPMRLSLEDQGVFILGYYHQRINLYQGEPKTAEEADETTEQEESVL